MYKRQVLLSSYQSRTSSGNVASGRFTLTSPALVTIRHDERGPEDSVGELYEFSSSSGLVAENDDPQPGRRFFEIQDALLRPNFEYCLDVLPFDSSETWSAVTLELDVTSFDNIVTLSSTDIQLTEGGEFTLSVNLSRALGSNLRFTLFDEFSGEADEFDFEIVDLGNQQTIPAGETSGSIVLTAVDDLLEETAERRTFAMSFNDVNNNFVTEVPVVLTIIDNDQPAAINQPPVISPFMIPQLQLGESLSFTVQASDPENDTISYNLNNAPGWLSVSPFGVLEGTPDVAGSSQGIQLTASDGRGGVTNLNFGVAVVNPPVTETGDNDGGGGSLNLGLLLFMLTFTVFARRWNDLKV